MKNDTWGGHLRGSDKENLFNNQEFLQLVIIFFILMTLIFDLGMVWSGESHL